MPRIIRVRKKARRFSYRRAGCLAFLLVIVAVLLLLGFSVLRECGCIKTIPKIERGAPPYELAPETVPTHSRVYFAWDITETKTTVTLNGYYTRKDKEWVRVDDVLPLDKRIDGAKVIHRLPPGE